MLEYRKHAVRIFIPFCITKWDRLSAIKNKREWEQAKKQRPDFDLYLSIKIKRLGKY